MDDRIVTRRGTGRHRLPGLAGVVEQDRGDDQDEHDGEDGQGDGDPGRSRFGIRDTDLGALLRRGHAAPLPRARFDVYEGAGALAWIERNRLWLIPWISALIVTVIEVLAALFASRPIPLPGHLALGAFWVFAVSRGSIRVQTLRACEARLQAYAQQRGIPLEQARSEWELFESQVARTALPEGEGDDD